MKWRKKIKKIPCFIAAIHWILTFFTDRLIFKYSFFAVSNMKTAAKSVIAIGTKAVFLLLLLLLYYGIARIIEKWKQGQPFIRRFVIHTGGYAAIMFGFLLLTWPGIWRMDEFGILKMAIQLLPHFWQNYLTSVWYIAALMFFPFPAGVVLAEIILISVIVGSIITKCEQYMKHKKWVWIWYVPFLCFPVIDSNLYPIRMSIYAFLELLLAFWLGILAYEKKEITKRDVLFLAGLTGIVASFRTEAIYYIFLAPLTFIVLFWETSTRKIKTQFILSTILITLVLTGVQTVGNHVISGDDYEITSVVLPIAPLLDAADENADSTLLDEVDAVLNTKLLIEGYREGKTGISIYWSSHDQLVRTGYSDEQYAQMKSAYYQLIVKYPSVFLQERITTFMESTELLNESELIYRTDTNSSYTEFRDSYYLNRPVNESLRYSLITLLEGLNSDTMHSVLYSFYAQLVAVIGLFFYLLWKKKWGYCLIIFNICAKIPLIFLTAPSRLFMYYYSIYIVGNLVIAGMIWILFRNLYTRIQVR